LQNIIKFGELLAKLLTKNRLYLVWLTLQ